MSSSRPLSISRVNRKSRKMSNSKSITRSRKTRSNNMIHCDKSLLNSSSKVSQMFNKILNVMNSDVNLTGRAMIENELRTNKIYSFLFNKKSIFDVEKLLDLASKFINIPEKSRRVEEMSSGGSIFLINYSKTHFKYDVLAIITFILSVVLLYISYVRFNDLYETISAAELRALMPKGMFDGRVSLILEHFVSILPGCQEGNLQTRVITGVSQIVKEKVYATLSDSMKKAQTTCFTQISSDPNSIIQYVSSGFETFFDTGISQCVKNTMMNDFSVMVNQLTLNVNVEFGKIQGTVHMIFYSGACLFNSMYHLNSRIRMKGRSSLAITN
jgi:hypothetical protein